VALAEYFLPDLLVLDCVGGYGPSNPVPVNRRSHVAPPLVADRAGALALLGLLRRTEPFVRREGETGKEHVPPRFPARPRGVPLARRKPDPGLTCTADLSFTRFPRVESFDMRGNHIYNRPRRLLTNALPHDEWGRTLPLTT